jgi:hypothetical protein
MNSPAHQPIACCEYLQRSALVWSFGCLYPDCMCNLRQPSTVQYMALTDGVFCLCRGSSLLQTNSNRSSFSSVTSSSSMHLAAAAAPGAALPADARRSVLGAPPSAPRSRPMPLSASRRGGPGALEPTGPRSASPGGMVSTQVRMVNRAPLLNKAAAAEARDDSITVGDPAGLAVLLGDTGAAGGPRLASGKS